MKQKTLTNQRRKPQQQRALHKYNAVLDACTQVLLKQGYHKVTMLELSLESEVAVPTLYQYFENKDAIFIAWIDRLLDQVLDNVARHHTPLKTQPVQTHIEPLIRTALMAIAHYQSGLRPLLAEIPGVLSARMIASMEHKTLTALKALYAEQVQRHTDSLQVEAYLRVLIRSITGYFIQSVLNGERTIDVDNEAQELAVLVSLYLQHHRLVPSAK